jgi:hypothetical protein
MKSLKIPKELLEARNRNIDRQYIGQKKKDEWYNQLSVNN